MNIQMVCRYVLGLMVANLAFAVPDDQSKSPLGCRDLGYEFELNVLKILPTITGDRQSLYFVFNRLNQPVSLHQMLSDKNPERMYLNHVVSPQQWSVLATNQNELKYICALDDATSRHGKVVDCSESVKVCEFARVKYGLNNRGNYWFYTSNSRNGALSDVTHYGIIAR